MKIMYIFEEEQEAACGECGENCNLGAGSAPFDLHYCPHCGIQFIYGTKYLKNRIEFSKYWACGQKVGLTGKELLDEIQ